MNEMGSSAILFIVIILDWHYCSKYRNVYDHTNIANTCIKLYSCSTKCL